MNTGKFWIMILGLSILWAGAAIAADRLPSTIEVTGHARIMVRPDTVRLTFMVETSARQARDAVAQNAERTRKLLAAFKSLLGKKDTVRTASYSLSPVYDKNNRLNPKGFRVKNWVILESRQLDKAGQFIDTAVGVQAGSVGNLVFTHSDTRSLEAKAAVDAVRQARIRAAALADAAGLKIKRIRTINYGAPQPAPVRRYAAEMVATAAATPIVAGDIPIEASVLVIFETE